jgi:hypothetical protein
MKDGPPQWACKDRCGFMYRSGVSVNAVAHNCPKKKNANVDCVPQNLDGTPWKPDKKRVPSRKPKAQKSREETDMATKRAEPKAKAGAKPRPAEVQDDNAEKKGRRTFGPRGWLAAEVDKILRKTPDETVPVGEIVKKITNEQGEHPSTGAVAACVKRWGEQGYIKVKTTRPLSFNGYAARWRDSDLDSFLEAQKAKRAKARAAKD